MACGLPVIASVRAGASEIIRDGENGLLLRNPEDSRELAELLRRVYVDPDFREELGLEAAATAQGQTWDRNADATWEFLKAAHQAKARSPRG
jgi:glycosyltransferase involved in cell wall biosynthesis